MEFNDGTDLEMQIFSCFERELPKLVFVKGEQTAKYGDRTLSGWTVLTPSPFGTIAAAGVPAPITRKSPNISSVKKIMQELSEALENITDDEERLLNGHGSRSITPWRRESISVNLIKGIGALECLKESTIQCLKSLETLSDKPNPVGAPIKDKANALAIAVWHTYLFIKGEKPKYSIHKGNPTSKYCIIVYDVLKLFNLEEKFANSSRKANDDNKLSYKKGVKISNKWTIPPSICG